MAEAGSVSWVLDRVLRAWDYVRVDGRVAREGDRVTRIDLVGDGGTVLEDAARLGLEVPGEPEAGPVGFSLSGLVREDLKARLCSLDVTFKHGPAATLRLVDHPSGNWPDYGELAQRMARLVAEHPDPRVLEVGGRARSGFHRRHLLGPVSEYVSLDVLDGKGVDVVADAHTMSHVLGHDRFDFACSYLVWEHLALPWKVVVELNRVLKTGGYAFVLTPQACGLHDLPWDFFRFSDSAFRALFAPETGFEVVEVVRTHPMHLFPFIALDEMWDGAENAAGFFSVTVLVRKTGPTTLEWPVDSTRIVPEPYPA